MHRDVKPHNVSHKSCLHTKVMPNHNSLACFTSACTLHIPSYSHPSTCITGQMVHRAWHKCLVQLACVTSCLTAWCLLGLLISIELQPCVIRQSCCIEFASDVQVMIDHNAKKLRLIDWGLAEFYHPGKEYVSIVRILLFVSGHLSQCLLLKPRDPVYNTGLFQSAMLHLPVIDSSLAAIFQNQPVAVTAGLACCEATHVMAVMKVPAEQAQMDAPIS